MKRIVLILGMLCTLVLSAQTLPFSFTKKESGVSGNTLLVIGGIQGDEPGGFLAAALLATRYTITRGNVWVVPNLNFPSIIDNLRGSNGDMNRKFAGISKNDPDYEAVMRIKEIILDPRVDLVLNLHDGSGFYRETYIDPLSNPERWGQSCIIDQLWMNHDKFGDLQAIATKVAQGVNQKLINKEHQFRIKNTQTDRGNTEMEKALTWFAIQNNKPALANETSKTLPAHLRVYYQLVALESYMEHLGIGFERDFELTPSSVDRVVHENLKLWLFGKRLVLDLSNIRPQLKFVPFPAHEALQYESNNPLVAVRKNGKGYHVYYGNRKIVALSPQFFPASRTSADFEVEVDGVRRSMRYGEIVRAHKGITILPQVGFRTNAIGFVSKGNGDESGLLLERNDFMTRFSIDKGGTLYRIERYKGAEFDGMILVEFVR